MSRKKQYNEEEVLDKAMRTFWKNGFDTTSLRYLEQELGINQFSIYSSFKNKKTLFIRSIRKYRQYLEEILLFDLFREGANLGDLERFLKNYINNSQDSARLGCLVVNASTTAAMDDPEIAEEIRLHYAILRSMLKKIVKQSVAEGQISESVDIEKTSSYLLGIMQGLAIALRALPQDQLNDFISIAFENIINRNDIPDEK